jgi:rubredoxin
MFSKVASQKDLNPRPKGQPIRKPIPTKGNYLEGSEEDGISNDTHDYSSDEYISNSNDHDGGLLKCQFCDYSVEKRLSNLKQHVMTIHFKDLLFQFLPKTKPWLCPECNVPQKNSSTLLRHYAWIHNMFYKVASKEDIKPRPKGQPIRKPKSAKGQPIRDPKSTRPSIKAKKKRMDDSSEYSDDEGNILISRNFPPQ